MFTDTITSESKIQTAKTLLSAAGSLAAAALVFRQSNASDELLRLLSSAFTWFSSDLTLVIDEFDGIESNHIFDSATLYLGTKTKANSKPPCRLKISLPESDPAIKIAIDRDEPISDYYEGVWYTWTLISRQMEKQNNFYNPRDMNSTLKSEVKYLELSFNRKHKEKAMNRYVTHVIEEAKRIKEEEKSIKLFTVSREEGDLWRGLNMNHPSTLDDRDGFEREGEDY